MLQKVNNEKGLEAIKKCIDEPSTLNILGVLAASKSRSYVAGHIVKSAISYAFYGNKQKTQSTAKEASIQTATQADGVLRRRASSTASTQSL